MAAENTVGAIDRLESLLNVIDTTIVASKRKIEEVTAEPVSKILESPVFIKYFDTTSGKDYYYNTATGQTQWDRPAEYSEVLSNEQQNKQSKGSEYSSIACFRSKNGSFSVANHSSYWESVGRQTDKEGRQLSAFFDLNEFEKNRAEAKIKKEKFQNSNINWKEYKQKKQQQKKSKSYAWLHED